MITKLGSLFDGSGGFPLAGALSGIEPIWENPEKRMLFHSVSNPARYTFRLYKTEQSNNPERQGFRRVVRKTVKYKVNLHTRKYVA